MSRKPPRHPRHVNMPADDVERLNALVLAAVRGTITPDGRQQLIQLHKRREADLRAYDRYAANLREQIRRQERRAENLAQRLTDHTVREAA